MKVRKSYLTNFPTNHLFIVLEQNQKELLDLEMKQLNRSNSLLRERIKQVKLTIAIIRNTIIERYLDSQVSLRECAKMLIISKGVKESVYQEVFTLKLLGVNEIIPLDLLEKAIDKLEIDQLMRILRTKEDSIYGHFANQSYTEMLFDVENEILEELNQKIKLDY